MHTFSKIVQRSTLALLPALIVMMSMMWHTAQAGDPDFTTNDPLAGQWELSRITDLVLYQTHSADNNTKSQILNYFLETENQQISGQTAKTVLTAPCWLSGQREPQVTRAGRFFALGNDVVVTLAPSANAGGSNCASTNGFANMGLYVVDPQTDGTPIWTHVSASANETAMAMADFDKDGYEDLMILNDTEAFAATATDVYSPTLGMTIGTRTTLGSTALAPASDPVTADFNDDGLMDVAWFGKDGTLYFATVCPGSVAGTPCAGKAALDVILNPLNSRKTVQSPPLKDCWNNSIVGGDVAGDQALAAGNFFSETSSNGQQFGRLVAIGCAQPNSGPKMRAYSYKFDSTMNVTQQQFIDIADCQIVCGSVYAEGARLQWDATLEQVAFTYSNVINDFYLEQQYLVGVVHFSDANMSAPFNLYKTLNLEDGNAVGGNLGLATGHFSTIPDSADGPEAFDLRIAVALNFSPPEIDIFTVKLDTYTLTKASSTALASSLGILRQNSAFNKLIAGDLQGRSDRLGPPTKIKIKSHLQPAVVLGAPPMHADYVLPDQQTAVGPVILNFTVAPASYNTTYTQGGSTSSTSSRTDTTSYTYSYAESTTEKFSFNVPLISGVSGTLQQSWKQQYDRTSSDYTYSKVEGDYSLGQSSGLNDTVWYQSNDFYVYSYPVLGRTVCPIEIPNCDADQMQPLYVSFSGPVDSIISPLDGGTTEWYQPVHEEGQLFSYPWDISQLKARFPESAVMSTDDIVLTTDNSSAINRSVKWITDSQQQTSTQNTFTHSFESDNSITIGGIDKEEGGAELTGDFDYNSSKAVSTLNTSSTDIGSFTEIDLARPSFPNGSLYKYSFQPLVISQGAPTGTVQTIDASATVYTTTGTISTEYVLSPPTDSTFGWGDWWGKSTNWYKQSIDIALNHPNRWNDNASACDGSEQVIGQCIQPNLPQLKQFLAAEDEPYISQWHHMRGLLVTVGAPGGPQRVAAEVGDDIYLQARVYNYSLKAMEPDDRVKVQFYRQGYADSALIGDAVLIAEVTVDPLPAFGNDDLMPNWTTATAQFTASENLSGTHQVFWVVTWAENTQGDMVQEVNGHGLTEKPDTLTSIVDVPIDVGPTVSTTTGTGKTSFSNNVGLFHQPFYIGAGVDPADPGEEPPTLTVSNLRAVPSGHQRFVQFAIWAEIQAASGAAEGVQILLIREEREATTVLDVNVLPFVAEGDSQLVRIPYTPAKCGAENLLLEVRSSEAGSTSSRITVDTECPSVYFPIIIQND